MQDAAERMQTLISDLLAFSRVTTRGQPFSQVDLREIAEQVVVDLEVRIEQVEGQVTLGELPTIRSTDQVDDGDESSGTRSRKNTRL